jgi:hypothetical protein
MADESRVKRPLNKIDSPVFHSISGLKQLGGRRVHRYKSILSKYSQSKYHKILTSGGSSGGCSTKSGRARRVQV